MKLNRKGTFLSDLSESERLTLVEIKEEVLSRMPRLEGEKREILQKVLEGLNEETSTSDSINQSLESFLLTQHEISWMDRNDRNQWIDYLVHRYKFRVYPSQHIVGNFPQHLLIEPTPVCNLRCVMCFQVDPYFSKKQNLGFMDFELYKQIVDEAKSEGCNAITLASRGEPALHRDFGRMLFYLQDKGIFETKINTNGVKLDEQLSHDILASGTSEVVFSVDASEKEIYEKIRVGSKFEKVLENIGRFHRIRQEYPRSKTITRISGVKILEEQDLEKIVSFWKGIGVDQIVIKSAIPRWDSYSNEPTGIVNPCSLLYERLYVWYDGVVNPCDFDYKSYLNVGNVKEQSLRAIWTGEKISELRRIHDSKQRGTLVPCDRCPIY